MKSYYFAYGMNTNLDSMSSRCPNAELIGAAKLDGYRFVFRRHADVELSYNDTVDGVLWLIDQHDLDSLDAFEGFPDYYIRSRAWVEHDDRWYIAWIYQMVDQTYTATPSLSYVHMCLEGYNQNEINTKQITSLLEFT